MLARPYLALVELADSMSEESGEKDSAEKDRNLLAWCRAHGLLGILLFEVVQITLFPRWEADIADSAEEGGWPTSVTYSRAPRGWVQSGDTFASEQVRQLPPEKRPVGALVEREFWNGDWEEPGVLEQKLAAGLFVRRGLSEKVGGFFPSVPPAQKETFPYPRPLSPEFWKLYAEKRDELQFWAQRFAEMVRTLGLHSREAGKGGANERVQEAARKLEALAFPSSPVLQGSLREHRTTVSLLGTYASMVLEDAAQGLLNICEECARVFVSSAGRARFCSSRCRKTVLQREWRARKAQRPEREQVE